MNAPVILTALTAENDLCETVLAGVTATLAIFGGVHSAPSGELLLHQQEDVFRYDRFVITFHIVLRHGAVVLDPLLCQEVGGIGLLKQCIQQSIIHIAWLSQISSLSKTYQGSHTAINGGGSLL